MLVEKKEYCSGRFLCPFALPIHCTCWVSNLKMSEKKPTENTKEFYISAVICRSWLYYWKNSPGKTEIAAACVVFILC